MTRYYNDYIKKKIIPPASEYHIRYITYLYAIIYAAYGFMPVFINFMNVIFHFLTAILIYKSAALIFDDRAAYASSLLFLLNPISFYYSSTRLQESLIVFIVYLCAWCFIMAVKKRSLRHAILIIPLLYIVCGFLKRDYFIPLLSAFAISSMVLLFYKSKRLFFALAISAVFLLIGAHIDVLGKAKFYAFNLLDYGVAHQRGFCQSGGQIYQLFISGKDTQAYTFMDWGRYILKGWYHMLSEPILSSNISAKLMLFFPVKIIFLDLCALAMPGALMALRYGRIESVIFLSMLLMLGTGIAISSGNVGTMLRHRDIITPVIFIFSSFYITRFIHAPDVNGKGKD